MTQKLTQRQSMVIRWRVCTLSSLNCTSIKKIINKSRRQSSTWLHHIYKSLVWIMGWWIYSWVWGGRQNSCTFPKNLKQRLLKMQFLETSKSQAAQISYSCWSHTATSFSRRAFSCGVFHQNIYCKQRKTNQPFFLCAGHRPFQCRYCPYSASQKGNLKTHVLCVHRMPFDNSQYPDRRFKRSRADSEAPGSLEEAAGRAGSSAEQAEDGGQAQE